jgi:hypothetical protein
MERKEQHAEDKSKNSQQAHSVEYRLDELLANSPKEAFQLHAENKVWLDGPLIVK